jgi:hypothetical protein
MRMNEARMGSLKEKIDEKPVEKPVKKENKLGAGGRSSVKKDNKKRNV